VDRTSGDIVEVDTTKDPYRRVLWSNGYKLWDSRTEPSITQMGESV